MDARGDQPARLTDHLSTYLFTTSRDADENLAGEGIPAERIHFVGNTMIDTLLRFRRRRTANGAPPRGSALERHAVRVLTLHRPDNVDEPGRCERVLEALRSS